MKEIEEARRLHGLDLYKVLDTHAEKVFDDLTSLAAQICETPISLVSLVDEKRQWFKSRVGLEAKETPRSQAFCAHTINTDGVMVIPDSTLDQRFAANPLVTGEPHIRFYAGAPLKMDSGIVLGTLCVIDTKPRELEASKISALETLRDAVVAHLELRRNLEDLNSLKSLLPMCAWCRSVKTDQEGINVWQPLHEYVSGRTEITHGVCPQCAAKLSEKP
jgi:GAF domain-containing protein